MPALPDLIAVLAGVGAVLGGIIGFAVHPASDRQMISNVVDGGQVGAILGGLAAFTIWLGGTAAGA